MIELEVMTSSAEVNAAMARSTAAAAAGGPPPEPSYQQAGDLLKQVQGASADVQEKVAKCRDFMHMRRGELEAGKTPQQVEYLRNEINKLEQRLRLCTQFASSSVAAAQAVMSRAQHKSFQNSPEDKLREVA